MKSKLSSVKFNLHVICNTFKDCQLYKMFILTVIILKSIRKQKDGKKDGQTD